MTSEPTPRRTRRRATARQGPPERGLATEPASAATPHTEQPPAAKPPAKKTTARKQVRPAGARENNDRNLRDLVGSGASQLTPTMAMRARDLNRPTDEDLAEAERDLVIVRRNWKPPTG
jgi:hypothetical protein